MANSPQQIPPESEASVKAWSQISQRPWFVWLVACTAMLCLAGLAFVGLTNPGPVDSQPVPSGEPTISQPVPPLDASTQKSLATWVIGAIILGCIGGSLLVSQRPTPSPPRKPIKPPAPPPTPRPPQATLSPAKPTAALPDKPRAKPLLLAASDKKPPQAKPARPLLGKGRKARREPQPVVTVVLPSESQAIAKDNLVESMDLRKRRSLSSFL